MARIAGAALILAGATLSLAGCTKKDDVPQDTSVSAQPQSAPSNDHAGQFLTQAIAGDIGEIQLARLALKKASDKKVRDFAQALVTDHGKTKDEATQLAGSAGAKVPTDARADAQTEVDKLNGLAGRDFDREFVSFMVNDHQQAVNAFQAEAGTSDPAPIVGFAKQALPALQNHLQMAESLATGLNGKGS